MKKLISKFVISGKSETPGFSPGRRLSLMIHHQETPGFSPGSVIPECFYRESSREPKQALRVWFTAAINRPRSGWSGLWQTSNNSGFTLIEIIVVLIIVGILASIALPNLFSNVSQSRAQEALGVISSYRPTVEGCIVKAAGINDDTNCTQVLMGAPAATANFTYAVTGPANATDTGYNIVATGTGVFANTDTITVTRAAALWPAFGAVTCVGAGKLLGAC